MSNILPGVNPGFAGGAYGYVAMGPYAGGQAQSLRVPFADFNCLKLPPGTDHESDFALLADIFPTGWHGLVLSGFQPGETVAVFGAGPVGLMAAYSGILRGASKVFVVDQVPERLEQAQKIGCVAVDFSKGDPVEQILKANGGMVDRAVDAVGYQANDAAGKKEAPSAVLESCIKVVRACGGIGVSLNLIRHVHLLITCCARSQDFTSHLIPEHQTQTVAKACS
jgi:threonine dehydrogenase-like Zn-dependent dehydrogenase